MGDGIKMNVKEIKYKGGEQIPKVQAPVNTQLNFHVP
jgi:hypothetical protein